MELSRAASGLSFVGALVIGIAVGYFAADGGDIVAVDPPSDWSQTSVVKSVPVRGENLLGVWRGTWGYSRAYSTIEIDRVDGKKFYGTLTKRGAKIAFVGTLDADARMISFRETKVLSFGEYSSWSLGTNTGSFSRDGRTLTGTGHDRWGTYGWDASKD